jgi:hypothetical protein
VNSNAKYWQEKKVRVQRAPNHLAFPATSPSTLPTRAHTSPYPSSACQPTTKQVVAFGADTWDQVFKMIKGTGGRLVEILMDCSGDRYKRFGRPFDKIRIRAVISFV